MAVYAVSDLHGQSKLWKQVKEYLHPSDTLICLGDCIDRGPDGFDILIDVLNRPNTHMLMGNHEKLMLQYYRPNLVVDSFTVYNNLWFMNGGHYTYFNMEEYSDEDIEKVFNQVRLLEYQMHYNNTQGQKIILDHCGYEITRGQDDPMWNRYHFWEPWPEDNKYKNTYMIHGHTPTIAMFRFNFNGIEDHSKQEMSKNPQILKYANGHKINIDFLYVFFIN